MDYRKALNITIDLAGTHKKHWREHPCKEMSFEHVEDMMERIDHENMSDTKLCRWLGWMQATVVVMTYPHTTLETMKNINKGCS